MALLRRPPSPERYEAARRQLSRVPGADAAAIDLCLTLWRFSDELAVAFEAFYAAHGLSRARGHLLVNLLDAPRGLTAAQLAERGGASPANITGLMQSLEREGLIRREPIAGDRRSQRIRLTAAGRRRIEALLPILARRQAQLSGALTVAQRRSVLAVTRQLCETAKAMPERSAPRSRIPPGRRSPRR